MNTFKRFVKYVVRHKTAYLMVAPLIIGILVFCYYPPIYGIILSFCEKTSMSVAKFNGLDNYIALFKDSIFLNSIPTMVYIQLPRLIAGIVVPFVFAELIFGLTKQKVQGVYRVLILLPVVAPGVVSTLLWKSIYEAEDGLMNALLRAMSIIPQDMIIDWLNDSRYVIFAILFMGFPWIGGASVLIYLSGIMNIPREVLEAAELDGAGSFRKIWSIHIPLLSGQVRYFFIFGLIGGLQDYGTQVILTNGGPGYSTYVPGYYMYELMYRHDNYGMASAIGTVLFVVIMILTALSFKFVKFGEGKDA